MDFDFIKEKILKFRDDRDWKQFHNPKDLATAIAIEASELQEKFLRKSQKDSYEISKVDIEVKDEVADIFNYLILFTETCSIDLEQAILDKIRKNNKKYPVHKSKGKSDKYDKL